MPHDSPIARRGEPAKAADTNADRAEIRRLGGIRTGAGLIGRQGPGGPSIDRIIPEAMDAQLVGTANINGGYPWAEVYHSAPDTWAMSGRAGASALDPAYERRTGNTGLAAGMTVYRMERSETTGAWLFAARSSGMGATPCGKICVTVLDCLGHPTSGATMAFMLGGVTLFTMTSPQSLSSITLTAQGTGYTSAPTVTISGGGGSGATATASIFGGKVTAISIANSGLGYTSTPTVTISGGGGSGATATAVLNSYCIPIYAAGTYTVVMTPPSAAWWSSSPQTKTVTVSSCSSGGTTSFTLAAATGYVCHCAGCGQPLPNTCTVTDVNGTYTATFGTWVFGNLNLTGWVCCYTIANVATESNTVPNCVPDAATHTTPVGYGVACPGSGQTSFTLFEAWAFCSDSTHLINGPPAAGTCNLSGALNVISTSSVPTTSPGIASSAPTAPDVCNNSLSFTITGSYVNGTVAVTFP